MLKATAELTVFQVVKNYFQKGIITQLKEGQIYYELEPSHSLELSKAQLFAGKFNAK